jgi:hypothetical protein
MLGRDCMLENRGKVDFGKNYLISIKFGEDSHRFIVSQRSSDTCFHLTSKNDRKQFC